MGCISRQSLLRKCKHPFLPVTHSYFPSCTRTYGLHQLKFDKNASLTENVQGQTTVQRYFPSLWKTHSHSFSQCFTIKSISKQTVFQASIKEFLAHWPTLWQAAAKQAVCALFLVMQSLAFSSHDNVRKAH